jgi:hypothetical protein
MSSPKVLASVDLAKTVAYKRFKLLCFLLDFDSALLG